MSVEANQPGQGDETKGFRPKRSENTTKRPGLIEEALKDILVSPAAARKRLIQLGDAVRAEYKQEDFLARVAQVHPEVAEKIGERIDDEMIELHVLRVQRDTAWAAFTQGFVYPDMLGHALPALRKKRDGLHTLVSAENLPLNDGFYLSEAVKVLYRPKDYHNFMLVGVALVTGAYQRMFSEMNQSHPGQPILQVLNEFTALHYSYYQKMIAQGKQPRYPTANKVGFDGPPDNMQSTLRILVERQKARVRRVGQEDPKIMTQLSLKDIGLLRGLASVNRSLSFKTPGLNAPMTNRPFATTPDILNETGPLDDPISVFIHPSLKEYGAWPVPGMCVGRLPVPREALLARNQTIIAEAYAIAEAYVGREIPALRDGKFDSTTGILLLGAFLGEETAFKINPYK